MHFFFLYCDLYLDSFTSTSTSTSSYSILLIYHDIFRHMQCFSQYLILQAELSWRWSQWVLIFAEVEAGIFDVAASMARFRIQTWTPALNLNIWGNIAVDLHI